MVGATLGGSVDILTISLTGFWRACSGVAGDVAEGTFSLPMTAKSSFLAGESFTLRFCRLLAAYEEKKSARFTQLASRRTENAKSLPFWMA